MESLGVVTQDLATLRGLRFGYIPYQPGGNSPGDRRRFPTIATRLGLQWEYYQDGREYDVIYVTSNGDLTKFHRLPKSRTKLAFGMADSYLAVPQYHAKTLLRGLGKWVLKKHSHLELFYAKTLQRMAKRSDLVICSTPEQSEHFQPFNPNTHDILDVHEELSASEPVKQPTNDGRLHIFWEGIGVNATHFDICAEALRAVAKKTPLTLHLVTDLNYKPLNAPIPMFSTKKMLTKALGEVDCKLTEWSQFGVKAIASHCDLGIIPMSLSDPLARNKPENKLLIMWRLGLPVLTSATPAYLRAMGRYGGPVWCCNSPQDWNDKLREAASLPDRRAQARQAGLDYIRDVASVDALEQRWLHALSSLVE